MKSFPDIITRDQIDAAYFGSLHALGSDLPPEAIAYHTERMEYCLRQVARIGVMARALALKETANA